MTSSELLRDYLRTASQEELDIHWTEVEAMNLTGPTLSELLTSQSMNPTFVITEENVAELRRLYQQAVEQNIGVFAFQGTTLLTKYAKHLLEYVQQVLDNQKR